MSVLKRIALPLLALVGTSFAFLPLFDAVMFLVVLGLVPAFVVRCCTIP